MSVVDLQPQQPTLGEMFGKPVERLRFGFKGLGGVLGDVAGARPLELDETGFIRIGYRVVEIGAGQSKDAADRVVRYHIIEALEAELEPDA